MTAPALVFDHASFLLNNRALVDDLTLSVEQGETLVLLGRSGSGKTTSLKLVNRLHDPSSGEVRVNGRPTTSWDPIRLRRGIGYVIQEGGLFPHFTVEKNIGLVPRIENWPPEKIRTRVRELLAVVGLTSDLLDRYPQQLSGGQRQRAGAGGALAADPPILLLDEPFGALDPITRSEIQKEFRTLQQRLGKTMIFVTHDIREAFLLGTRIGLMQEGQLQALVTPAEFLALDHPEARA